LIKTLLFYLKRFSIFEPVNVHAGVTQGHDAALHVRGLTLGDDGGAGQRRDEHRFLELRLILRDLTVGGSCPLQLGDLPHSLGMLRLEKKRSFGSNSGCGKNKLKSLVIIIVHSNVLYLSLTLLRVVPN